MKTINASQFRNSYKSILLGLKAGERYFLSKENIVIMALEFAQVYKDSDKEEKFKELKNSLGINVKTGEIPEVSKIHEELEEVVVWECFYCKQEVERAMIRWEEGDEVYACERCCIKAKVKFKSIK